jgi:ankyrin repeat protein
MHTPLTLAVQTGNLSLVTFLLERKYLLHEMPTNETLFIPLIHFATMSNSTPMISYLLNKLSNSFSGNDFSYSSDVVEVNRTTLNDGLHCTALHIAYGMGSKAIHSVRLLKLHGADETIKDKVG